MFKINKYCRGVSLSAIVGLYSHGKFFIIIVQQEYRVFAGKFEPRHKST